MWRHCALATWGAPGPLGCCPVMTRNLMDSHPQLQPQPPVGPRDGEAMLGLAQEQSLPPRAGPSARLCLGGE